MAEQAAAHAADPGVLDGGQEETLLGKATQETLARLRGRWGREYGVKMGGTDVYTAWRLDGTGMLISAKTAQALEEGLAADMRALMDELHAEFPRLEFSYDRQGSWAYGRGVEPLRADTPWQLRALAAAQAEGTR